MSAATRPSQPRWRRALRVLQRRGVGYLAYLTFGVAWPKLVFILLYRWPRQRLKRVLLALILGGGVLLFVGLVAWLGVFHASVLVVVAVLITLELGWVSRRIRDIRRARRARRLTAAWGERGSHRSSSWRELRVANETRRAVEEARRQQPNGDLVIARLDNDGRCLGLYGPLPDLPQVMADAFVERRRFPLEIVLDGDQLLVRKSFAGDKQAFLREWIPLAELAGHDAVPALARIDEERLRIYKHLLLGQTVRDRLVERGARILSVETEAEEGLARMSAEERIEAVWQRAHPLLEAALPTAFIDRLEAAMNQLHAAGVTGFSLTFGNVVVASRDDRGEALPIFLDFDNARCHRSPRGLFFTLRRDQDREKFNRIYNRQVMTERSARTVLTRLEQDHGPWYAPIDFGGGLTVDGFWTVDSGTGRWGYLNRRVVAPLVARQRVLDLGSNNGLMPVLMLRSGARRVDAVEQSDAFLAVAHGVQRIFEWRDLCSYDLHFHQRDMRFILNEDPGRFDVVTAFCSLYYLEPDDMALMVRRMAELAPLVILQAKDDTRPEAARDKATKSSSTFLTKLLRDNGFPEVERIAPRGFSRPLLIGRAAARDGE